MSKKRWLMAVVMVLCWIGIVACGGGGVTDFFKTSTPSELVGTWRAQYTGIQNFDIKLTGVETLTLRVDGTYQQIYDDDKGYMYTSPWNSWHLDSKEGRLYLESGRAYYLGTKEAEQRAKNRRGAAICTYLRNERVDVDCADVILFTYHDSSVRGGVVLESPELGDPDDPEYVRFYLIATPVPTATAVR